MGTRDTAARVRGVSRCAKNLDRTRTRGTRFGSTAGLTIPVLNASDYLSPYNIDEQLNLRVGNSAAQMARVVETYWVREVVYGRVGRIH